MLSLNTVGARLVGQQQHSGVLNLPDGAPALVIDGFIPAVFHILLKPLVQPLLSACFTNIQNPFVFASGVLFHKYIHAIKRGGGIEGDGFKMYGKAFRGKNPIDTRHIGDALAGKPVKCF